MKLTREYLINKYVGAHNFIQIPEGYMNNPKGNGVFCMVASKSTIGQWKYDFLVLMTSRWDCQYGNLGGHVDGNEDLMTALRREAFEEGLVDLSKYQTPKYLSSYNDNGFGIHTYYVEVTNEELLEIRANVFNKEKQAEMELKTGIKPTVDELAGLCVLNVSYTELYKDGTPNHKLLDNLLNNSFSATAKLELIDLILLHQDKVFGV